MSLLQRISDVQKKRDSLLCIGLDPHPEIMHVPDIKQWTYSIIQATKEYVCAYKFNLAFYMSLGPYAIKELYNLVGDINRAKKAQAYCYNNIGILKDCSEILLICDGKFSGIPYEMERYATSVFQTFGFDIATVNPYFGLDSIYEFTKFSDKGTFVICHSSNLGARDLQEYPYSNLIGVQVPLSLYKRLYYYLPNNPDNIGVVMGTTFPKSLNNISYRNFPLLLVGFGQHGGKLEDINAHIKYGNIINISRSIISLSKNMQEVSDMARIYRDQLNKMRINNGNMA